ncbi:hypothetical protein HanXRQr2_Chr04g0139951 [Helianthus annuus]|uniref:Uncharacterized protein n=1 Tax=Helianthus annuus TaxID=4232 RepID=A0A9K3J3Z0_HELAN|nr:hypothetical protein HanXRQr2_Chr04g0139951 [Helianthus annuus]
MFDPTIHFVSMNQMKHIPPMNIYQHCYHHSPPKTHHFEKPYHPSRHSYLLLHKYPRKHLC